MSTIKKSVLANILAGALEFKQGNKKEAARLLALATSDEDFLDTVDGTQEAMDDEEDPFADEDDGEMTGPDVASLIDPAPKKGVMDIDDGESPGDADNEGDDLLRPIVATSKETARIKQMRSNLLAMAKFD